MADHPQVFVQFNGRAAFKAHVEKLAFAQGQARLVEGKAGRLAAVGRHPPVGQAVQCQAGQHK